MIDYGNILSYFYPNKSWRIENSIDYDTLKWNDSSPKPTREELDFKCEEVISIQKKQECKNQAKFLIAKYDFAVLPDRSKDIQNIDEIITYRDTLLSLIKNPIENPIFPDPPEVIWR